LAFCATNLDTAEAVMRMKAGLFPGKQSTVMTADMTRRLIMGMLFAASLLASGSAALGQGVVRAKYGDWELRCDTPPGASKELCALVQRVADEDKPNISLEVIVIKLADGSKYILRVIAPLGVILPSGLGLKIDETDIGRAGFVRCLPDGCVAEVVLEAKLIDQLKNGQKAFFIIFQTPEEGIGIPLALPGFKEGFNALS